MKNWRWKLPVFVNKMRFHALELEFIGQKTIKNGNGSKI